MYIERAGGYCQRGCSQHHQLLNQHPKPDFSGFACQHSSMLQVSSFFFLYLFLSFFFVLRSHSNITYTICLSFSTPNQLCRGLDGKHTPGLTHGNPRSLRCARFLKLFTLLGKSESFIGAFLKNKVITAERKKRIVF